MLRKLWMQHVYWTRMVIISMVSGLGDAEEASARLLQNPKDFAELLAPYYGKRTALQFQRLFSEHLLIAADLVSAAKAGDTQKAESARKKWYRNADEIAWFLSGINPHWNREKWRQMLYSHLAMTEKEAVLRLGEDYAADIKNFEEIEKEALDMADYMLLGMQRQFF